MIDFAAIADQYRDQFAVQTHAWPVLFDRMDKLLDDLGDRSRDLERATRAYPLLRYRDGAVGVRVAVGPTPPLGAVEGTGRSLGEGLSSGARDFVSGIGLVGTMVEQELALPRELAVLEQMAAAVEASLARFENADSRMFDAGARRFSDVFGLAGLGWRALQGPRNQSQIRQAGRAFALLGPGPRPSPGAAPGGPAPGGPAPGGLAGLAAYVPMLDEKARLTADVVLLLPAFALALDVALDAGVLAIEEAIIGEVATVEQQVTGLRTDLVEGWLAAFDVGSTVHHLVSAADVVITADGILLTTAVPRWLDGLLDGVETLLRGLRAWTVWTTAMMGAFRVATTDLMSVDLMPWIVRNALSDWVADHVPMPSFTVDELVGLALGEGLGGVRDRLDSFLDRVDDALWAIDLVHDMSGTRAKVAALRVILRLTMTPTPFTYPPDVMPTGPLAGFPDVYEAVFGGTRRADLIGSVRALGADLQRSVHDIGTAGAGLATGLAATAEDEMRHQARSGAGLELQRRWATGAGIVEDLAGPIRRDVAARAAGEPAEPLAEAFEARFGGAAGTAAIGAVAAAVPAYIGEAREFWSVRTHGAAHPTSVHVLARNGRLGMVRVPRLTLTAPGRRPDDAFAAEVADRFHGVVQESYRNGRAQLVALAAPQGGARRGR